MLAASLLYPSSQFWTCAFKIVWFDEKTYGFDVVTAEPFFRFSAIYTILQIRALTELFFSNFCGILFHILC